MYTNGGFERRREQVKEEETRPWHILLLMGPFRGLVRIPFVARDLQSHPGLRIANHRCLPGSMGALLPEYMADVFSGCRTKDDLVLHACSARVLKHAGPPKCLKRLRKIALGALWLWSSMLCSYATSGTIHTLWLVGTNVRGMEQMHTRTISGGRASILGGGIQS